MAIPETGLKPIQYFDDPADYFRQLYDDENQVQIALANWKAYKASGKKPSEYYGYETVEFDAPTAINKKEDNKKVKYIVQAGAFSTKTAADNYVKELAKKGVSSIVKVVES